jgi:hypothetical protein
MAAGLGFKTFTTGEVLTAADTNGYLMQGVLVFADAAARDAAITSPQEGQFAYLKDTDVTTYYTSSAWANLDTTGMTNPMTTTADMIYSSSGSTPARLGIGTVGQVLTVNSGATAPEWATAASGGGLTLINSGGTALSGASTSVTSIPNTYKNLHIYIEDYYPAGAGANGAVRFNNYVSDYSGGRLKQEGSGGSATPTLGGNNNADRIYVIEAMAASDNNNFAYFIVPNYASSVVRKVLNGNSCYNDGTYTQNVSNFGIWYATVAAIDSVQIMTSSTWSGGTVYVYGEN